MVGHLQDSNTVAVFFGLGDGKWAYIVSKAFGWLKLPFSTVELISYRHAL